MNTDHNDNLYNTLLNLSRNKFFYSKIGLDDTFETRLYLMFFHFSLIMICFKKKGKKFNQNSYDKLFHNIENNLRELGFGDVSVNKKMKDFNKILYDILIKLDLLQDEKKSIKINSKLVKNYFETLNSTDNTKLTLFLDYLLIFFNFCFDKPLDNMIEHCKNFEFNYGST
tara:strand:+ start:874 stop:1383 length:510 start_codon:yes stop_codon:yes gene_type:complete